MSTCFALGAATAEQVKRLAPAEAGPLAGLGTLPSLRTLRPALAATADAACLLEPAGGNRPGDERRDGAAEPGDLPGRVPTWDDHSAP